nr:hypothetical protein [Tanacetum cinerariifolium]
GADSCFCAVAVAEMVRLGVAELGIEEFKQRSGAFDQAKTEVTQAGAGGKAHQEVEAAPEAPQLTEQQQLVRQLLTCAYQGT